MSTTIRPGRGRVLVAVAVVVLVAVALVVWRQRGSSSAPAAAAPAAPSTATVTKRSLVNDASFDGTISHQTAAPVTAHTGGTLTWIVPEGATVNAGDVLFRVDGVPTFVFAGTVPAWRDLSAASTPGPDIHQLEQNLVDLGYDPDRRITVDDTFTDATLAAVQRWQATAGLDVTGEVALGSVVYEPTPLQAGAHSLEVGAPVSPGAGVLELQTTAVIAQFTLPSDERSVITIGEAVTVNLPDRSQATGTIDSIGTTTDADTGAVSRIGKATIQPRQGSGAIINGSAVKVKLTQVMATDVLVVSGTALRAQTDGTYTVTVVDPGGATRVVPVAPGANAVGLVAITGDGIGDGTKLVVPSNR